MQRRGPTSILIDALCSVSALARLLLPSLAYPPPQLLLALLPTILIILPLFLAHRHPLFPLALCLPSLALLQPPSYLASAFSVPPVVVVVVPVTAPALPPVSPVIPRATNLLLPLAPPLPIAAAPPLSLCLAILPPLRLLSALAFGGSFLFSFGRRGALLLDRCFLAISPPFRHSALTLSQLF
jgi:hypothetical protein